jgi:CRISPR system Cascade subunit CasB
MEQKHYLTFSNPNDPGARDVLIDWWKELDTNRGDRAQLRRCHSPLEVAFTPVYHRLRITLMKHGVGNDEKLKIALIAGILSHLKKDTSKESFTRPFPEQMAVPSKSDGKKARVNNFRFQRLLKIKDDDRDKLYETLIRIVHLIDYEVDIPSLANGIYWWNERTKKEWAFAYYEHAPSEEK